VFLLNGIIKHDGNIEVLNNQDLTILKGNVKQEIIPHFSLDEMKYLLSLVPLDKRGMLFNFLWRTGVRVSECISIKKSFIDFDNDEISIRWLKNRKAHYRVIPLHYSLKNPLYMFCSGFKADQFVFPISRQRVFQLCQKWGFNNPHKIRHSFAINFIRQNDNPSALFELQKLLGHSDINTTMIYLKVVPSDLKKSVNKIRFD